MTGPDWPEVSRFVWEARYRDAGASPPESRIEQCWRRVARAVAAAEQDPETRAREYLGILDGFRFLPAGRILAGAGTSRHVTLFSCFVMGTIEDSIEGIFDALKEGALTMQRGGGIGYDFSPLRPRGSRARMTGMTASGPVSFLELWDAMCSTMLCTGARRGAMMGTLAVTHPDILEFIDAKRDPGVLRNFNLSVLVTDAFLEAVAQDAHWKLVFPAPPAPAAIERTVAAREVWKRLCASAWACAEPGVLFIDRINSQNNLGYCETIRATNPCGEEPLPPHGACNLGSINLPAFVRDPFGPQAALDVEGIAATAATATRFLDNVIDLSHFPLPQQRREAERARRIGLGMTGLADALVMLGVRYDVPQARHFAAQAMRTIRDAAYRSSAALAAERGPCPAFRADAYLGRPFIRALPEDIRAAIRRHGIRNSHLTAIAPAGSISLLAGNVSSGIEPVFRLEGTRRVLGEDAVAREFAVLDHALATWRARHPATRPLPEAFLTADRIAPQAQLEMQAAIQPFVDGAISKTVALPDDFPEAGVAGLFQSAWRLGLKGCTLHRAGARRGVITR
ncbi:MAG TPA: adenosylcobalamin-dependent ribonucleoside-diphosphate reductase [Steroidobacteraceae bacterium]|nr:adenosylcobalamin-dependent ribonucleoside-diphosphate reductase [Steroidobacteraceae bacterium]